MNPPVEPVIVPVNDVAWVFVSRMVVVPRLTVPAPERLLMVQGEVLTPEISKVVPVITITDALSARLPEPIKERVPWLIVVGGE